MSWIPGSWMRMRSSPWRAIVGSATLNLSIRLRSVSTTCLSVSTPSTRWIPPCRSSPRLIAFFGGYRYQSEPRSTTRTMMMRVRRFLGILVALHLHDAPDRRAFELELHLVRDTQGHGLVGEIGHGPEHAARGDDLVAALDRRQHTVALRPLLLLRSDHQEIEDGEHRAEHDERRHELRAADAAPRRGRHRPGDVGEKQVHRAVSIPDHSTKHSARKTRAGRRRTFVRRLPRALSPS